MFFNGPDNPQNRVDLSSVESVCSPYPVLYIIMAVMINTTACNEIRTWNLLHCSQASYHWTTVAWVVPRLCLLGKFFSLDLSRFRY